MAFPTMEEDPERHAEAVKRKCICGHRKTSHMDRKDLCLPPASASTGATMAVPLRRQGTNALSTNARGQLGYVNNSQQMLADADGVVKAWGGKPGVKGEVAALIHELVEERFTWEKAFDMHECGTCEPTTCNLAMRARNNAAGWPDAPKSTDKMSFEVI